MKTITINLYSFDELSEKTKQRVKDSWQFDDFWSEERNESQKKTQRLYDKFGNLGEEIGGIRLYKFIQNHLLPELKNHIKYTKSKKGTFNKYPSSKIYKDEKARFSKIFVDYEPCNLTGYCNDYDFLYPIFDFLKNPTNVKTSGDLAQIDLNKIAQKCYEDDYESFFEDENFAEHCSINNYTFEESGKLNNG